MHDAFDGPLPDGWEGGVPVTKYWKGEYIRLYHVTRPCGTCGSTIGIDVTKKALQGLAKNSGLLLRNCPSCRAARKAGGVGSRGGTSRPVAIAERAQPAASAAPAAVPDEIVEELAETKKLLDEAYEANADLMQQAGGVRRAIHETLGLSLLGDGITYDTVKAAIESLKAKYELQAAVEATAKKLPWG